MSSGEACGLFLLYAALIIIDGGTTIYLMAYFDGFQHKKTVTLVSGLLMGLAGSAVTYARKLYQACINNTYTFATSASGITDPSLVTSRLGTLAFFLFRPLFGVILALVVYALWRLSISASGADAPKPEAGSLYITVTLGFLSGFLAGRVLEALEGYGTRRIGLLVNGDE